MWGIFAKVDGWYQISPAGLVTQLGGGGGGVVTSAALAERKPDHYEQLVTTTIGAAFVATTIAAPPGCYIERVLVRVVSATAAFHVGVLGAEKRWGDTVSGNVSTTNLTFAKTPAPVATGDDTVTVRLTCASGTFNGGTVRVTIFFVRFTAAAS